MKSKLSVKKFLNPVFVLLIVLLALLLLVFPDLCREGGKSGILLCSNVIIPTLFPFTFCSLFITNSKLFSKIGFLEKPGKFLFGLTPQELSIMLLSFIGGYPTGAKLIDEYTASTQNADKANLMLCYCVNAGPAFIIIAVGSGILNSRTLGVILLCSHITASLLIALILKKFLLNNDTQPPLSTQIMSPAENIVKSASDAADAVFSVCIYVILFAVINSICDYISLKFELLQYITPLLEVTTAVSNSGTVYHISFLLGFSGLCVACQISGIAKNFRLNFPLFILSRTLHGFLSMVITYILIKVIKPSVSVLSNNVSFKNALSYKDATLTAALIVLGILFIISTFNKNAGKYKESMLQ